MQGGPQQGEPQPDNPAGGGNSDTSSDGDYDDAAEGNDSGDVNDLDRPIANGDGGSTPPPPPTPPPMADFEDVNEADPPEVMGKLASVKVPWDRKDVGWWFSELEMQMTLINIKSQWIKRVILSNNLPDNVKQEVKSELRKTKSQAATNIYKILKTKVLNLFGPKEGERFEEAAQLNLAAFKKPSALAKRMTELLCECDTPLEACCSAETVSALWRRQLPQQVRSAIAGTSLKTSYDDVLQKADDVYASLGASGAPVSAVGNSPDEEDVEVAAFGRPNRGQQRGRPRGRSRGGYRGGQRGGAHAQAQGQGQGQGQGQSNQRGKRHADQPPESACRNHWKFGRAAYFCNSPETCPWASEKA